MLISGKVNVLTDITEKSLPNLGGYSNHTWINSMIRTLPLKSQFAFKQKSRELRGATTTPIHPCSNSKRLLIEKAVIETLLSIRNYCRHNSKKSLISQCPYCHLHCRSKATYYVWPPKFLDQYRQPTFMNNLLRCWRVPKQSLPVLSTEVLRKIRKRLFVYFLTKASLHSGSKKDR